MMVMPPPANLLWLLESKALRINSSPTSFYDATKRIDQLFNYRVPGVTRRGEKMGKRSDIVDMHQVATRHNHFFGGFRCR